MAKINHHINRRVNITALPKATTPQATPPLTLGAIIVTFLGIMLDNALTRLHSPHRPRLTKPGGVGHAKIAPGMALRLDFAKGGTVATRMHRPLIQNGDPQPHIRIGHHPAVDRMTQGYASTCRSLVMLNLSNL